MAMNEGDKAIVREIAFEVANEMITRFERHLRRDIRLLFVGVSVGAALFGFGGMAIAAKILSVF